jgi:hypothetical protein
VYRHRESRGFRHEATLTLLDACRGVHGIGRGGGRRTASRRIVVIRILVVRIVERLVRFDIRRLLGWLLVFGRGRRQL